MTPEHKSYAGRVPGHLSLLVSDKRAEKGARLEILSSLLAGARALASPSHEAVTSTFLPGN